MLQEIVRLAKRLEESALKELNVVALLGFILYVGLFLGCNLLMLPVNQDKTVQHINLLLLWFNLFTLLSSKDAKTTGLHTCVRSLVLRRLWTKQNHDC